MIHLRFLFLLLLVSLCASPAFCRSWTLYAGSKGSTPDAQGWGFLVTGGGQTPPGKTGMVTLSTLGNNAFQGGYVRVAPAALNRQHGYTLGFVLQVVQERHAVPDRAGVDLIVIGSDDRGLELGFWQGHVWAQSDHPLFHHAEGAAWNTARLTHYALIVRGNGYRLSANGRLLLTGPLRDYRAFQGPINPYRTPNLIFLGDDTHAAAGELRLAHVSLQTEGSSQGRHKTRTKS